MRQLINDMNIKDLINPLLAYRVDEEAIKEVIKKDPEYIIGEIVDLETWGGTKENLRVIDIKVTYHPRLNKYTWGYMFQAGVDTGFSMKYIPEGYLRKKGQ